MLHEEGDVDRFVHEIVVDQCGINALLSSWFRLCTTVGQSRYTTLETYVKQNKTNLSAHECRVTRRWIFTCRVSRRIQFVDRCRVTRRWSTKKPNAALHDAGLLYVALHDGMFNLSINVTFHDAGTSNFKCRVTRRWDIKF